MPRNSFPASINAIVHMFSARPVIAFTCLQLYSNVHISITSTPLANTVSCLHISIIHTPLINIEIHAYIFYSAVRYFKISPLLCVLFSNLLCFSRPAYDCLNCWFISGNVEKYLLIDFISEKVFQFWYNSSLYFNLVRH